MHLTPPADLSHDFAGVLDRLSARLQTDTQAPLALGLSGGSDSLALLKLASTWAQARGRRVLALTVDHGLNPDSARWTAFARDAALAVEADWQGLRWQGPKPVTGLPAAARRARHALLAEAARAAGARVILLGHTADDVAEADWMRAEGSTMGRVREWSPSPVWPEGRGLMLLRPMLDVRRQALRDWLTAQGADWIDDPGNEDVSFARTRARRFLLPLGEGGGATALSDERLGRSTTVAPDAFTLSRQNDSFAAVRSSPLSLGEGVLVFDRTLSTSMLAAALVSAGGGERMPRGDRLTALAARLGTADPFTATLCGARIDATPDHILIHREAGEFTRRPPPDINLTPCVEAVWDGRWAITIDQRGWTVTAAAGRMAALSEVDRALLKTLPAAARPTRPVLIRNDRHAPVLAGAVGQARSLVEQRLALALDAVTHERHLS
ncbi:tRNA lysidine(34) synthetase TilS [uncultured Brevundimonas sp.]|uniref:tRNA lysidine(34) synthetase TilS n=1 Tax=uncultured Brevundimonas sp. TaxID=213418 RepID=UPI0025F78614|nr:tRNA lysidine(34) synthetase TilS [uncultured Brevundimonas sp.]